MSINAKEKSSAVKRQILPRISARMILRSISQFFYLIQKIIILKPYQKELVIVIKLFSYFFNIELVGAATDLLFSNFFNIELVGAVAVVVKL